MCFSSAPVNIKLVAVAVVRVIDVTLAATAAAAAASVVVSLLIANIFINGDWCCGSWASGQLLFKNGYDQTHFDHEQTKAALLQREIYILPVCSLLFPAYHMIIFCLITVVIVRNSIASKYTFFSGC